MIWGKQCHHKGPYQQGRGGRLENQRGAGGMEAEAGVVPLLALELEEGATAPGGQGASEAQTR